MKILWRREWLPTPVFLPEEFYGQRRLVSYSPWGCKESDMTEQLTNSWLTMFQEHSKVIYKSFSSPVAFKHGCSLEIYLVSGLSVSHSVISDSLESHGLWPARLLHPWDSPGRNTGGVAIPFSRGSFQPKDQTWVFCIAGRFFIVWATREIGWQKLPLCSTKLFLSPKVCTMQRFPLVAMKPCLGWMKTYIGSSQNLNKKPFR